MTSAWAHLPNAVHIDRVIESFIRDQAPWHDAAACLASDDFSIESIKEYFEQQWPEAENQLKLLGRDELFETVYATVEVPRKGELRETLVTLIAYDDCGYMIDSEVDELLILATLGNLEANLLLPACTVFSKERNK